MKQFYKKYRDIFQMETLTRTQKDIITILINRAEYHNNKPFYCYESWIATEVKCSEKTVKRAIKHFAEIGLLDIKRTYNKETHKTINYYTINFDTTNNEVVNETENVVSNIEEQVTTATCNEGFDWDSIKGNDLLEIEDETEPTPSEKNIDNYSEKVDEMIDIDNTYIPDCIAYPNEDIFAVKLSECKRLDKPTPTITDDVLNNIKNWLVKNIGKKEQATIYYKDINKKYGYNFRTVMLALKELDKQGVITYSPIEKDGKLLHYYSIHCISEERELELVIEWIKYVKCRVRQYKEEIKQVPTCKKEFYKNIIDDVNEKINVFSKKGVKKTILVNVFNEEFAQKSAA